MNYSSFREREPATGFGFVLRDAAGQLVAARTMAIAGCALVYEGEVMGNAWNY